MTRSTHGIEEHPARAAAERSMAAIVAGDREGWLALFADDAIVEDPIGVSPFDPSGSGHRGRDAIAAFYDDVIAPNRVDFLVRESYACGDEVANVVTITTTLPDGSRAVVDVVSTYRVNALGDLLWLRAFWELDKMRFEPALPAGGDAALADADPPMDPLADPLVEPGGLADI